jgi:hypothetical protein
MPQLILAIEPDRRQASRIAAVARNFLEAELVVTESAEEALGTLRTRVPDLILTPLLLSPKDENALDDRLRQLDAAGTKVQTLVTPMLAAATARKPSQKTGLLTRLRKTRSNAVPDGCEPSVFAAQITEYLDRVLAERRAAAETLRDTQRAAAREARNAPRDVPPATPVDETSVDDLAPPAAATFVGEPAASLNDADPFVRVVTDDAIPEIPPATAVESVETYAALAPEPDPPAIVEERIPEAATIEAPPPRTMRESVLAAFKRRQVEPQPVPDFAVTEAAAIPDFAVVEVEEQPVVAAVAATEAASSADALVSASAAASVLHDATLAAELAAILGTTVEEIAPSEIAGSQDASAPLAGFQISLDDDGWESIELEVVEAVSDRAPSRPVATPEPLIATSAPLVATPEPVAATPVSAAAKPRPSAATSAAEPAVAAAPQPDENAPRQKLRGANRNAFAARIEARLAQLGKGLLKPPVGVPHRAAVDAVDEPLEDEPEPSADDYDPKIDLWMPLAMGSQTDWPRLAIALSVMPAPAPIAVVEVDGAHASKRSASRKKQAAPKPAQDEWGLFDPQQCGFAALLAKLDEVTDVPSE